MKKLPVFFLLTIFFLVSPSLALANKCGVNVGPNYHQVSQVASMTKTGGWIVALGSPGDCSKFETLFGKGLNVVIRAYNGGKKFDENQALGWIATLGKMDTQGKVVYFMPWNEPDHPAECGGGCTPGEVINYVTFLKNQLAALGLNNKVKLLSPMLDTHNFPAFTAFSAVYNIAGNSSINLYDQNDGAGYCSTGPCFSNCHYAQCDGVRAPYYAVETGVTGNVCGGFPCYRDDQLAQMLARTYPVWAGDSGFQMFAIFSYDPHKPGWNIFSASNVISFYSQNCTPGSVTSSGTFDQTVFDIWLAEMLQTGKLISCGGCGYASDPVYCLAAGIGGEEVPEIIDPENTLACNNFDINYRRSTETHVTIMPTPTPAPATPTPNILGVSSRQEMRETTGELYLKKQNFPDFSLMERKFFNSLQKLLPEYVRAKLFIDQTPLKTRAKHFIVGINEDGSERPPEEPIPLTEVTLPSWWTAILGESKILCFLKKGENCENPKSVVLKVKQPDIEKELTDPLITYLNASCPTGEIPEAEDSLALETKNANFKAQSVWNITVEVIDEMIDHIRHIITRTEEKTKLKNKTRELLVGGETLNKQTSFLEQGIPAYLLPANNAPLAGKTEYELRPPEFQAGPGSEKINYQDQALARLRACLKICGSHPEQFDITTIDPLCISCKSTDYITPSP